MNETCPSIKICPAELPYLC